MPGDLRSSLLALGAALATDLGPRPVRRRPRPSWPCCTPRRRPCHRSALRATVVAAAAAGLSAAAAWSLTVAPVPGGRAHRAGHRDDPGRLARRGPDPRRRRARVDQPGAADPDRRRRSPRRAGRIDPMTSEHEPGRDDWSPWGRPEHDEASGDPRRPPRSRRPRCRRLRGDADPTRSGQPGRRPGAGAPYGQDPYAAAHDRTRCPDPYAADRRSVRRRDATTRTPPRSRSHDVAPLPPTRRTPR